MTESKDQWLQRMCDQHGLDPEDILEVAEMCIEDAAENINALKSNGPSGNLDDNIRYAHSIKGSCANVGFDGLAEVAKHLEFQLKEGIMNEFDSFVTKLSDEAEKYQNFMNA